MYQIIFYVPNEYCERVKEAVFRAGAGAYPGYDACSWQVVGEGQFRPLKGSSPFIGSHGQIEHVVETRVELICRDDHIHDAIAALKDAHPYEQPAFSFFRVNEG